MKSLLIILILLPTIVFSVNRYDIDKSNMTDASGNYYLLFIAHGELPFGHAFVGWGKESWHAKQSVLSAYGFYPYKIKKVANLYKCIVKKQIPYCFKDVPGIIVDDIVSGGLSSSTEILSVKVNKSTYDQAKIIRDKWKEKDYNLLSDNCISFTIAVAKYIGLKVVDKNVFTLPETYMKALIEANRR